MDFDKKTLILKQIDPSFNLRINVFKTYSEESSYHFHNVYCGESFICHDYDLNWDESKLKESIKIQVDKKIKALTSELQNLKGIDL